LRVIGERSVIIENMIQKIRMSQIFVETICFIVQTGNSS